MLEYTKICLKVKVKSPEGQGHMKVKVKSLFLL